MAGKTLQSSAMLHRLTDGYLALMLLVFLIFPGFGGYIEISLWKYRLFTLLSCAYLILTALLALELCVIGALRLPSPKKLWTGSSIPQKLIIAYWLWTLISTICSINPSTAFWGGTRHEGLFTITLYCAVFLLVSVLGRPARWQLWLFGIGISLCCTLALIQLGGFNPFSLYPEGMNYYDAYALYAGQFLGTIGNVDLLAAVLCIAIPACWVGILRLSGRLRFLLLIPLLLSLSVLLLSYVEAGIVGVFGGGLLTIPIVAAKKNRIRGILAIGVGAFLVIALILVYFFGSRFSGFIYEAAELLHGHWDDSFGSGRLYIWRNVLDMVPERLMLGGGPDTLVLRGELYFERYDENLDLLLRSIVDTAHNEYLNILVNQGLPAMLLYLAALIYSAVQWVRTAPSSPAVALCGGMVLCYCVQAFFGISAPITAPYFWLALGLLLAALRPAPPELPPKKKKQR